MEGRGLLAGGSRGSNESLVCAVSAHHAAPVFVVGLWFYVCSARAAVHCATHVKFYVFSRRSRRGRGRLTYSPCTTVDACVLSYTLLMFLNVVGVAEGVRFVV